MLDIKTTYMGLQLKNPIIVASGPLTASLDKLKSCEDSGVGAVVLKSIFEEQINHAASRETANSSDYLQFSDFHDTFDTIAKDYFVDQYLHLVSDAKSSLDIPVIASINCTHIDTWSEYATKFESAGADALELNYYPIASDASVSGEKVDKQAIEFAKAARKMTKLPISLKIGSQYSSLAYIIKQFEKEGINSLVLFNHFFRPDIDINELHLCSIKNNFSSATDYSDSLRWIALMSSELKNLELVGNTGIHNGDTIVKMLLAGAKAVEICSVLMKEGPSCVGAMLTFLEHWMEQHGYNSLSDFRGVLSQERMSDGAYWERTQYMRTLGCRS